MVDERDGFAADEGDDCPPVSFRKASACPESLSAAIDPNRIHAFKVMSIRLGVR